MAKKRKKYNITDEDLHRFIISSHSYVEDYECLYNKLFLLDVLVDKIDFIDLSDFDTVDLFLDCVFHLVKDILILANSLHSKSNDVCFKVYEEGLENGRK